MVSHAVGAHSQLIFDHKLVMVRLRCHFFHPVVSLASRHPIEFWLLLLLAVGFLYNAANQSIFWMPAEFVPEDEIAHDIHTCTPPAGASRNDVPCPVMSERMRRPMIVTQVNATILNNMASLYGIKAGGSFTPTTCVPPISTSIIIPFRNRTDQLNILLMNLHPFLIQQQISYQIFVVEQADEYRFNRGKLLNIGYKEGIRIRPSSCCFVFHDVDLIPEHEKNVYACSRSGPRHMSAAVNTFRYNLLYRQLFGGVTAVKKKEFKELNGFSNMFYGWGGEDDDFSSRITSHGMSIIRWDMRISRYNMLSHRKEKSAGRSITKIREQTESHVKIAPGNDGLSSLSYKLHSVTQEPLFTRITVSL